MPLHSALGPAAIRRAVPVPAHWKARAKEWGPARAVWTALRRRQVLQEYRARRDHYARLADSNGITYDESEIGRVVTQRLAARGATPVARRMGEIHTFACIPLAGWHRSLLPDLRELGPVTHFDYVALGYGVDELARADGAARQRRTEMLGQLRAQLFATHQCNPIDWIFCYGGGQDTSPSLIREVADTLGIPAVNMSLDDKQGWIGRSVGECRTGAADITAAFDLFLTSARVACEWHMLEGGRPLYSPEGFDIQEYHPRAVASDMGVSFVGVGYGARIAIVDEVRRAGIPVATFGAGWPNGRWADDMPDIFSRSAINLGMGGIEYAEWFTNLKGRDFEVPATGGGMYLTTYNADLAQHFELGREIVCYASREELIDLLQHFLRRPDDSRTIARQGYARCVAEHRWLHRYVRALRMLGILATDA